MSSAYVIEMNNDTNKIEGIGAIRVYPSFSETKSVYNNKNYNHKYDYSIDLSIYYSLDFLICELLGSYQSIIGLD